MINYLFQVVLFQVLFLFIYDLFLSKETFFTKNRFYLLFTALVSFVIPFFKVASFQSIISNENIILLPEVILSPQKVIENTSVYQSVNYLNIIYVSGFVLCSLLFIFKLIKILNLIVKNKQVKTDKYHLILLPEKSKAFSFFNYIFIGKELSEEKREKVLAHEFVHCKQKHTLDLLFFELMKTLMWFNPVLYMYQRRITMIHEFIADEIASNSMEKTTYINSLLSEVFQVENITFVNQFYRKPFIRKRIIMMRKITSKEEKKLKYLLLVPLLLVMVFYTSCANEEEIIQQKQEMIMYYDSITGKKTKLGVKTYMDLLYGIDLPKTREYTFSDLTKEERKEYNSPGVVEFSGTDYDGKVRIFEGEKGRKVIFYDEIGFLKSFKKHQLIKKEQEYVPFSYLHIMPTFAGCSVGDGKCLEISISNFVKNNLSIEKLKALGLSKGTKRTFVRFKIDKEGNVFDIKARESNIMLKHKIEATIKRLPKFRPGRLNDENVITKYSLPIVFDIK